MSEPGRTIKDFFFNDENELRCLWRVLIFVVIFQIGFWVIGSFVGILAVLLPGFKGLLSDAQTSEIKGWSYLFVFAITQVVTLSAVLLANGICARLLERRSFASTGFKFHPGWGLDFLYGSLFGAAFLALAAGLAMAAGAVQFQTNNTDVVSLLQAGIVLSFLFLISAANEEALLRGFAFQALDHNLGSGIALVLTSVVFGLLHLQNSNVTLFSTLNTCLAGVWLGLAYLRTRSLWLATAMHYAWNFVMVFVFGLPVSGIKDFQSYTWLSGQSTEQWISGGDYGPEGGAAATLALLIAALVTWKSRFFKTTAEMAQAIQHGKPEKPLSILTAQEK